MGSYISGVSGNGIWEEKPFICLLLNSRSRPHCSSAANPFLGQGGPGAASQSTDTSSAKGSFLVKRREAPDSGLLHAGSGESVLEWLGPYCPGTQTCFSPSLGLIPCAP